MEVEKRGVKGGFFQLFDWNGKSRKKLFSSKSDIPESSSHGKDKYHGPVIAPRQLALEKGIALNNACQDDYPYTSLVSGDSEQGTKAPGVVARLMGLDSLPSSDGNEPCFNPFTEPHSFRDSSYLMATPAFHSEHDTVIFESVRNKLDGSSRNPLDLRFQKVQHRPLDRFQREVLPPKSAKPISVTHNRLLSPIKSPGFIPPKDAAYIMEAAAKIIERSPRPTCKGNFPSIGSPSVPFRVWDAKKEKMESARRSSQSADVSQKVKDESCKNIKKQLNVRGKGRLEDSYLYKESEESKRASSQRLRNKEKAASLAVQAKPNIQKKDGITSSGTSGSDKQKNHIVCVPRDLPNATKKAERQSSSKRPSAALRLNNQKQNRAPTKNEDLEVSFSQPKEKQEPDFSANYINRRTNRTVNKIVVNDVVTSRKTNFVVSDPGREVSSLKAKATSKKRLPINGNIQSSGVAQKAMVMKDVKSVKCNVAFECDSNWDAIDKQSSLDVVSFTFTSPIKKSVGANSSGVILEATSSSSPNYDPRVCETDSRTSAASSSGFNVIGGDALSVLLDQKLKELTSKVEFSQKDMSGSSSLSSYANNYGNMSPTGTSKLESEDASDSNSADKIWIQAEKSSEGLELLREDGDGDRDSDNVQRYLHSQGSTSILSQPSLSGASCDSFDVNQSSSNDGPIPSSCDGTSRKCTTKPHLSEGDPEVSDTASSLPVGTMSETVTSNWELKYIRDILSHADLLSEEFCLGQAHKIVAPDVFVELEDQKMEPCNELERKVLFDCVCECLELRCRGKQKAVLERRPWLADDLYREIWGWRKMEEVVVDEVVERDMSSKNGRWVEFEDEAFEEAAHIENRILTSVIDELLDDFFF